MSHTCLSNGNRLRRSTLLIVACAAVVWPGPVARGQITMDASAVYGRGVHAYFANQPWEADRYLSEVIDAGATDPRAYYFRAMARLRSGRRYEAEQDMQLGAMYEAQNPGGAGNLGQALTRVQGPDRHLLERYRREARLALAGESRGVAQARYDQRQRRETEVLRQELPLQLDQLDNTAPSPGVAAPTIVAPTLQPMLEPEPPAPVNAPAPATAQDDPFGAPPVAPATTPEPAAVEAPAAIEEPAAQDNPFGFGADAAEAPLPAADAPTTPAPSVAAPAETPETPAATFGADDDNPFGAADAPAADVPTTAAPPADEPAMVAPAEDAATDAAAPATDDADPFGAAAEPTANADPFGAVGAGADETPAEEPVTEAPTAVAPTVPTVPTIDTPIPAPAEGAAAPATQGGGLLGRIFSRTAANLVPSLPALPADPRSLLPGAAGPADGATPAADEFNLGPAEMAPAVTAPTPSDEDPFGAAAAQPPATPVEAPAEPAADATTPTTSDDADPFGADENPFGAAAADVPPVADEATPAAADGMRPLTEEASEQSAEAAEAEATVVEEAIDESEAGNAIAQDEAAELADDAEEANSGTEADAADAEGEEFEDPFGEFEQP